MTPLSIAGGQIRYAVDARRGPVPHSSLCLLGDLTDTRRRRRRRNCGASCGVAQMRCCKKKSAAQSKWSKLTDLIKSSSARTEGGAWDPD